LKGARNKVNTIIIILCAVVCTQHNNLLLVGRTFTNSTPACAIFEVQHTLHSHINWWQQGHLLALKEPYTCFIHQWYAWSVVEWGYQCVWTDLPILAFWRILVQFEFPFSIYLGWVFTLNSRTVPKREKNEQEGW